MKKGVIIGIGIAIIGSFFVIQDLGYQTNTDPNAPDPNVNPDKFNSPEPEPLVDRVEKEPEPPVMDRVIEKEPEPPVMDLVEEESEPPVMDLVVEEPEPPQTERTVEKESKPQQTPPTSYSDEIENDCSGNARCFSGKATKVIDGDTIRVNDHTIRFALSSAPEMNQPFGIQAREFIEEICPVGSSALVDEDDGQTDGSYERILAVIYCNNLNLNEELLDTNLGYLPAEFCDDSEFASTKWAKKHGCQEIKSQIKDADCDSSYPDVCIPSPPPDLDCKDIPYTNFRVLQPDPHRFDGNKDGIGCKS